MTNIQNHYDLIHEPITLSTLENVRRKISSQLFSVVQQMKWVLKSIVVDVTKDPITLPNPFSNYIIKVNQLRAAINRTYEVEAEVEYMSQKYLEFADILRQNIAIKIVKTQKRSEKIHQKTHKLYELVSSGAYLNSKNEIDESHGFLTDPYLIQKNQQRIIEYSKKLLEPIQTEVYSNLLEENKLISSLK